MNKTIIQIVKNKELKNGANCEWVDVTRVIERVGEFDSSYGRIEFGSLVLFQQCYAVSLVSVVLSEMD